MQALHTYLRLMSMHTYTHHAHLNPTPRTSAQRERERQTDRPEGPKGSTRLWYPASPSANDEVRLTGKGVHGLEETGNMEPRRATLALVTPPPWLPPCASRCALALSSPGPQFGVEGGGLQGWRVTVMKGWEGWEGAEGWESGEFKRLYKTMRGSGICHELLQGL